MRSTSSKNSASSRSVRPFPVFFFARPPACPFPSFRSRRFRPLPVLPSGFAVAVAWFVRMSFRRPRFVRGSSAYESGNMPERRFRRKNRPFRRLRASCFGFVRRACFALESPVPVVVLPSSCGSFPVPASSKTAFRSSEDGFPPRFRKVRSVVVFVPPSPVPNRLVELRLPLLRLPLLRLVASIASRRRRSVPNLFGRIRKTGFRPSEEDGFVRRSRSPSSEESRRPRSASEDGFRIGPSAPPSFPSVVLASSARIFRPFSAFGSFLEVFIARGLSAPFSARSPASRPCFRRRSPCRRPRSRPLPAIVGRIRSESTTEDGFPFVSSSFPCPSSLSSSTFSRRFRIRSLFPPVSSPFPFSSVFRFVFLVVVHAFERSRLVRVASLLVLESALRTEDGFPFLSKESGRDGRRDSSSLPCRRPWFSRRFRRFRPFPSFSSSRRLSSCFSSVFPCRRPRSARFPSSSSFPSSCGRILSERRKKTEDMLPSSFSSSVLRPVSDGLPVRLVGVRAFFVRFRLLVRSRAFLRLSAFRPFSVLVSLSSSTFPAVPAPPIKDGAVRRPRHDVGTRVRTYGRRVRSRIRRRGGRRSSSSPHTCRPCRRRPEKRFRLACVRAGFARSPSRVGGRKRRRKKGGLFFRLAGGGEASLRPSSSRVARRRPRSERSRRSNPHFARIGPSASSCVVSIFSPCERVGGNEKKVFFSKKRGFRLASSCVMLNKKR